MDSLLKKSNLIILSLLIFIIIFIIGIQIIRMNADSMNLNKETFFLITNFINLLIMSGIPFIFGMLGAITRILISGFKISSKNLGIIIASGFMSIIAWVSIKSGILTTLLLPHLDDEHLKRTYSEVSSEKDFYSIVLVALLVGMFSSNIYIMVNNKVEEITRKKDMELES